jgi:cytoskeletal protein RodZ
MGFGEWLRRSREARGVTLEGITQETRIPRKHLEAIERGNLSLLPEFYQRAEVRAIARTIGLDEEMALARLQSAVTPVQPVVDVPPIAEPARRAPTGSIAWAAGALVLGAVLLWWGVSGWSFTTETAADSSARPAQRSATAPLPLDAPAPTPITLGTTPGITPATTPAAVDSTLRLSPERTSDVALPPPPDAALASPATAVTELVVTSEPEGARVTVNGIGWGTTPIAIRHLPPGEKRIRVSKVGFQAAERVLVVEDGRRQSVSIPLPAVP